MMHKTKSFQRHNTHLHTPSLPPSMTTYIVSISCNGYRLNLDYWADGNGTRWPGYVTSFSQLRRKALSHFRASEIEFYYTRRRRTIQITDSDDLRAAVSRLDDRDVLKVTAYADWDYTNYGQESDSESDSDTEYARSEDSDDSDDESEYYTSYNNQLRATLRRFTGSSSERRSLPWDGDAPAYPLYARSDYAIQDEVCHLQYLLTRLGYMSLSATSVQTGSYQSYTKEAVRSFREHYGIYGRDMTKYNRSTATKLAQVVRQYRRAGYTHL